MKQEKKNMENKSKSLKTPLFIEPSQKKVAFMTMVFLLSCGILTFAVQAYNKQANSLITSTLSPKETQSVQGSQPTSSRLQTRLSLQPTADRMRRKLGNRFQNAGKEITTMVGTLSTKGQNYSVRIVRSQGDEGEQIAVGLNGGPLSLTWTGKEGATSTDVPPNNLQREVVERLALDSPDQFILAQLRGASYSTIAQNVVPSGTAEQENYSGPVWDFVRILEPQNATQNYPQSLWRLYYINTSTGLIDKIISQEGNDMIVAEISSWDEISGEKLPTHIKWTRNQQVDMELNLNVVSYSAR